MFYAKDGLAFERQGDKVRIIKTKDTKDNSEIIFVVELTLDTLASAVAEMCDGGKTSNNFQQIRNLLGK